MLTTVHYCHLYNTLELMRWIELEIKKKKKVEPPPKKKKKKKAKQLIVTP